MARDPAVSLVVLLLLTALAISVRPTSALPDNPRYKVGEYIPLFANKVHSLNDPCEAYSYFALPFCPPGSPIANRKKSFTEVLEGDCFTNTQYDINFKMEKIGETLCEKYLTKDEIEMFRYAVKNRFEYQMYYNNIRLRGIVGKVEAKEGKIVSSRLKFYLLKHINFYAYYMGDQVKDIYLMSDFDSAVDITEDVGIEVNFTYSVFWKELKVSSENSIFWNETLMDNYGWPTEQPGRRDIAFSLLYWDTIFFCWVGLVLGATMPYLLNYINRYSNGDVEQARGLINLRQIHGDACSCPPYPSLLGAILGIGTQLLILFCSLFGLSFKGYLYPCNSEALFTYILLIYCLTSSVSGYTATSFHSQYTAIGWKECIFQTGVLFFVPVFITVLYVSALAETTFGLLELPEFGTPVVILLIWGVGTIIFLAMGGKIGYEYRSNTQPTCDTSRIPRQIRQQSWYMNIPAQIFLGGILPFMTIFKEMDNIYASLWNLKVCGAFSTMLMSFIAVIIPTIFVGMGFTYWQLSKNDYQWWWRSVLRGGSTAIFMFSYGFYFHAKTGASDYTKLIVFLGYNACIFYACFLVLGTIGFYASFLVFHRMNLGADQKYE